MSFFNEVLNYFKIEDLSKEITISLVLGVGVVILGDLKIIELSDEKIILKSKKKDVEIIGKELYISSISKGEIVIAGKVFSVVSGGV